MKTVTYVAGYNVTGVEHHGVLVKRVTLLLVVKDMRQVSGITDHIFGFHDIVVRITKFSVVTRVVLGLCLEQ